MPRLLGAGLAVAVLALAGTAHAVITYDDTVTSNAIYGTGNGNGSFTVDRRNGIELGLRGHVRFPAPAAVYNSNGDGTYTFKAGVFNGANNPQWNYDWSVNTNYDGSGANVDAYTYKLELDFDPGPGTNFLAWDQISYPLEAVPYAVPAVHAGGFYDHSFGNNATATGTGVEATDQPTYAALLAGNNLVQQSWRYTFNTVAPFNTFDANATGDYEIRLTAYSNSGLTVVAQVSIHIQVEGFVTNNTIYGSGNSNGGFSLTRANGVEIGLRGHVRWPAPAAVYNNNFDGSYTFDAGVFHAPNDPQWSFDWSVNTDWKNVTGQKLDDYTYLLELDSDPGPGTSYFAFDNITPSMSIPFFDHAIGTNATGNGAGSVAGNAPTYAALLAANNLAQNSWYYTFFAPYFSPTFDPTLVGQYNVRLTVLSGMAVVAQTAIQIQTVYAGTCFIDETCDDGVYCNGVETCNLSTNTCEAGAPVDCSTDTNAVDFESPAYSIGNINGQDGWLKTGPFDVAVSSSLATSGFDAQSLRFSNAVTSGSFGNQTFSKPVVNEVGETTATSGTLSGGSRRSHFESQFDIASAVPGSQQVGLVMSTSADRGDGSRMTYLRFEDKPAGIEVYFDDYQDVPPYGVPGQAPFSDPGCGVGDDFVETLVATLDRTVPHTVLETLDVIDGPRNDIVNVYIDSVLVWTGTSWEDYFRWCEVTDLRTVDRRLFRAGGAAAPGTAGNGFLLDNVSARSGYAEGDPCVTDCNEVEQNCISPENSACTDDMNPCTIDQCDDSGTCTHTPGNAGATCRASAGVCDQAEVCDGVSAACPVDTFLSAATTCRGAAGVCDVAENCTGAAAACPADAKSVAVCRASAGVCDLAETCDGVANTCPADAKSVAVCRTSAGSCDVAETCNGIANTCPTDAFLPAATLCRGAAGVCDVAETCTGAAAACPADAKSVAVCRASAGVCDVAETCDGVANACPTDAFLSAATTCRGAAGVCDVAETCTGAAAACPVDAKSVAECRASTGECDVAETCDGISDDCAADAFVPAATVCTDDGDACTDDVCDGGGACTHPFATSCLDSSMALSQARIMYRSAASGRGRAGVAGLILDTEVGTLSDSLLEGNVSVTLTAGTFTITVPLGACSGEGRIKCRNTVDNVRASFAKVKQGQSSVPDTYKMRVTLKSWTSTETPLSPVEFSLVEPTPAVVRTDSISACTGKPGRLRCRED